MILPLCSRFSVVVGSYLRPATMVAELDRELGQSSEAENSAADEAESSSDEEPAAQPAPPPAPQPAQRCARCGSTRNLELLLPTGRWANLPMEQRLFCDTCIEAAA